MKRDLDDFKLKNKKQKVNQSDVRLQRALEEVCYMGVYRCRSIRVIFCKLLGVLGTQRIEHNQLCRNTNLAKLFERFLVGLGSKFNHRSISAQICSKLGNLVLNFAVTSNIRFV